MTLAEIAGSFPRHAGRQLLILKKGKLFSEAAYDPIGKPQASARERPPKSGTTNGVVRSFAFRRPGDDAPAVAWH